MFTLGTFSAFFWTLAAIILAMLIFEDKLIALEEKYDKKREAKRMAAKRTNFSASSRRTTKETKSTISAKRVNRNFAA